MAAGDLTFEGTATVDVPTAAEVAAAVAADARLAHLDADVSSRAAAASWTPTRAALLDHLVRDVPDVSALSSQATVDVLGTRLTGTRAAALDRLDVPVSSRAAPSDIPEAPDLTNLDAAVSSRAAAASWTPARAALLDHLVRDVPDVSGLAAAADVQTLLTRVTALRAAALDRLDVAVSTRADPAQVAATRDAVLAGVDAARDVLLAAVAAVAAGELTVAEVAAAVWDALAVDHGVAGSMAELVEASGSAADPLLKQVPSGYAAGTAGAALGRLFAGPIRLVTPLTASGDIAFVSGDAYLAVDSRQIDMRRVEGESWPTDLGAGWALSLVAYDARGGAQADGATVTPTVPTGAGQAVRVELPSATTAQMRGTSWRYAVEATKGADRITLRRGRLLPVAVS